MPLKKKVVRVALRLSAGSLAPIIKLRPGRNLGVIGHSPRFADLLYRTAQTYGEDIVLHTPVTTESGEKIYEYLQGKDALLVPVSFEKYFSDLMITALHKFNGSLIECHYEMDAGSLLYLETKIKRLLDDKKI